MTPTGCSQNGWDQVLGVVETTTDLNQKTTVTDHDAWGRPTVQTRPDHSTSTTQYLDPGVVTGPDTARQRTRTLVSDESAGDGVHWHEDLVDGLGRIYRTRDEGTTAADSAIVVADTVYGDASDRPAATSQPHTQSEPARWTTFSYDALHRPTSITHPGTPESGTATEYRAGVTVQRDELGHETVRHHDRLRPHHQRRRGAACLPGLRTRFPDHLHLRRRRPAAHHHRRRRPPDQDRPRRRRPGDLHHRPGPRHSHPHLASQRHPRDRNRRERPPHLDLRRRRTTADPHRQADPAALRRLAGTTT